MSAIKTLSVAAAALALSAGAVWWLVRRAGRPTPLTTARAGLVLLAAALVVAPSAPPETALLVLPLAALAVRRWRDLLVWQALHLLSWVLTGWYVGQALVPTVADDSRAYWLAVLLRVVGLAAAAVGVKLAVLLALARGFGLRRAEGWVFAVSMSQVGEFAFVLSSLALSARLFAPDDAALFNAVVALSMLTTPLLLAAYERWAAPRRARGADAAAPRIDERNAVIVAAAPAKAAGAPRRASSTARHRARRARATIQPWSPRTRTKERRAVSGTGNSPSRLIAS